MKKSLLIVLFLAITLICSCSAPLKKEEPNNALQSNKEQTNHPDKPDYNNSVPKRDILNYEYIKAIWLSQFDLYNVYTDNGSQREKNDFTQQVSQIIDNISELEFNTVILQIRPNHDSFYPSEFFPPSKYVTGNYSKQFLYDPIEIIIAKAKEKDLSVQAWINPYRCMNVDEIKTIDDDFLIKKWYSTNENNIVLYNGYYYLDPYYKENQNLILNGIEEILNNYKFDGIHIDDYFYPTNDSAFDAASFNEYKENGGTLDISSFRRNNVSCLVSSIYSLVKNKDERLLFGVSPAGNLQSTYNTLFADVYLWCSQEGFLDYISPQLYFGLEHQSHPFNKVFDEWNNIIKIDSVSLIPGLTLEKAYTKTDKWAGTGKNEWAYSNDIIRKCIIYTFNSKKCMGISLFSYQFFYNTSTNERVKETYNEIENFKPLLLNIVSKKKSLLKNN